MEVQNKAIKTIILITSQQPKPGGASDPKQAKRK